MGISSSVTEQGSKETLRCRRQLSAYQRIKVVPVRQQQMGTKILEEPMVAFDTHRIIRFTQQKARGGVPSPPWQGQHVYQRARHGPQVGLVRRGC